MFNEQDYREYRPIVLQSFEKVWRNYLEGGTWNEALESAGITDSDSKEKFTYTLKNTLQKYQFLCVAEIVREFWENYEQNKPCEVGRLHNSKNEKVVREIFKLRNILSHYFESQKDSSLIQADILEKYQNLIQSLIGEEWITSNVEKNPQKWSKQNSEFSSNLDTASKEFASNVKYAISYSQDTNTVVDSSETQYNYMVNFFKANFKYYKAMNVPIMSKDVEKICPFESMPVAQYNYLTSIYNVIRRISEVDKPFAEILSDETFLYYMREDDMEYLIPTLCNPTTAIDYVNISIISAYLNEGIEHKIFKTNDIFQLISQTYDIKKDKKLSKAKKSEKLVKVWETLSIIFKNKLYHIDNENNSYFSLGYHKNIPLEKMLDDNVDKTLLERCKINEEEATLYCLKALCIEFDKDFASFCPMQRNLTREEKQLLQKWKKAQSNFKEFRADLDLNISRQNKKGNIPSNNSIKNILTHFTYILSPRSDDGTNDNILYWWNAFKDNNEARYRDNLKFSDGSIPIKKLIPIVLAEKSIYSPLCDNKDITYEDHYNEILTDNLNKNQFAILKSKNERYKKR